MSGDQNEESPGAHRESLPASLKPPKGEARFLILGGKQTGIITHGAPPDLTCYAAVMAKHIPDKWHVNRMISRSSTFAVIYKTPALTVRPRPSQKQAETSSWMEERPTNVSLRFTLAPVWFYLGIFGKICWGNVVFYSIIPAAPAPYFSSGLAGR